MAKSKTTFRVGEPIVMRGRIKFTEDERGRVTIMLDGYEIPITTHMMNVHKAGAEVE